MAHEREYVIKVADDLRILVCQSGRPITGYAVLLQVWEGGEWRTIRLIDNAHGRHEMHRYTRREGKRSAESFHHGKINDAIPDAIADLRDRWETILAAWKRS